MILGTGACTPYPINAASAYTLCRDKAYTNLLLSRAGLPVIPTSLYFVDPRRAEWRRPGRELQDLLADSQGWTFPVFAKPNMGSRGEMAERIADVAGLTDWVRRVSPDYESVLIQPVVSGAEYRVFVLDGEALFSYRKSAQGHRPANLAQGGQVSDFREGAPPAMAALAIAATRTMGLRLAGIDLFAGAPTGDADNQVVIEVNANPNLESLEIMDRQDLVLRIWTTVFSRDLIL
ncbi:ATP-grasp domain-containing protein [Brevundimonas sp.]|uniref:ATP-grasp domain-containing protein n=1 Tax=Brevundimonas sp. TaxID=1871086 RepID=UPI003D146354